MSYQSLNSVLWNERQLLELLIFKLEQEQLLLASGKTRWLTHSTAEIERVLEQIAQSELPRSIESNHVALELGLAPDSPLLVIAENAPEPWNEILHSHRTTLLQLATEVETLSAGSRELLTTSQRAVQDSLANLDTDQSTYDASGGSAATEAPARLFDQNL